MVFVVVLVFIVVVGGDVGAVVGAVVGVVVGAVVGVVVGVVVEVVVGELGTLVEMVEDEEVEDGWELDTGGEGLKFLHGWLDSRSVAT